MSDLKACPATTEIIRTIESWLDWQKDHRDGESLKTDDGTHMVLLPVPMWPSRGTLKAWVKHLSETAEQPRWTPIEEAGEWDGDMEVDYRVVNPRGAVGS